jgi:hypothetical protein
MSMQPELYLAHSQMFKALLDMAATFSRYLKLC